MTILEKEQSIEENIPKLGRIKPEVLDPNNKKYPALMLLSDAAPIRQSRSWDNRIWLNQKKTPHCVPFGWSNLINAGPIKHKLKITEEMAHSYYPMCQDLDEIPGNNYDGSTTLGGAKTFQKLGHIGPYYWSFSLETTVAVVRDISPMVIGIDWSYDMFNPDKKGFIKTTGGWAGGHEILISGVNTKKFWFRLDQTWGRVTNPLTGEKEWGIKGRCWITWDQFGLLIDRQAEMCIAIENKIKIAA